jgi:hypothetical protein
MFISEFLGVTLPYLLLIRRYVCRASEGTLSCWSLHLQSLASTPVSRMVDVRQAAGRKNKCRIFITYIHTRFIPEGVAEVSQIFLQIFITT